MLGAARASDPQAIHSGMSREAGPAEHTHTMCQPAVAAGLLQWSFPMRAAVDGPAVAAGEAQSPAGSLPNLRLQPTGWLTTTEE